MHLILAGFNLDDMQFERFQYFELLSLLVALFCYKGLRRFSLGIFLPLLVLVNLLEMAGVNYRLLGLKDNNYILYNLLIIAQTPMYLYVYTKMMMLKKSEQLVFNMIAALCFLFLLLDFVYIQGPWVFNTYSATLISVLNIVFCSLILLRLFMVENKQVILYGEPYFWITASYMLFSLVTLVFLGLQPYIRNYHLTIGQKTIYRALMPYGSIILYSAFSYAFLLCRIRKTN
jgi:hypothetical protein